MDFPQFLTALLTNGIGGACAGAVLWFSWWRETKYLPKLLETFSGALAGAQTNFATAHKEMQETFGKRQAELLATFTVLTREERTNYQKWHEEDRDRLDQLILDQREHRHALRDLAHVLGIKQAVEEAKEKKAP